MAIERAIRDEDLAIVEALTVDNDTIHTIAGGASLELTIPIPATEAGVYVYGISPGIQLTYYKEGMMGSKLLLPAASKNIYIDKDADGSVNLFLGLTNITANSLDVRVRFKRVASRLKPRTLARLLA
jgi:hypothetical protein